MSEYPHTLHADYAEACEEHQWFSTGLSYQFGVMHMCAKCNDTCYIEETA